MELEKFKNLELQVSANCCSLPQPAETMEFSAEIGRTLRQSVEIVNNSKENWILKPWVEGRFFTADNEIEIPANKNGTFNVFYNPLESFDIGCKNEVIFF